MSQTPASILFDETGQHAVGVLLDGVVYRIQSEALLHTKAKGTTPSGHPTSEHITNDRQALHVTLLRSNEHPQFDADVRVVDGNGNPVGIILDGALYRFQTDSKAAKGVTSGGLVHLDALDTSAGRGRLKATLYSQEGEPIAFGSVAQNPASIRNAFVANGGGATSLLVNGSATPVVFTYNCDATYDISVQEVKFVLAANGVTFGTNYFGSVGGPLTNGLLVEIIAGGNTGTVANLKQNEDFVCFASPGGFEWVVSSKDMMSSNWLVGGGLKLIHGTSDKIQVTVRDNISAAGVYFKCFVKGNLLAAV